MSLKRCLTTRRWKEGKDEEIESYTRSRDRRVFSEGWTIEEWVKYMKKYDNSDEGVAYFKLLILILSMKQCNKFSLPSIFRLQNKYHFIKPLVSRLYCFLPKNVSTFLDMFIQNLPQIYLPLVILYEHGRRGARIAAFMWIYNFGDCLPRLRNNNTFHVNREKHDGFYRFQCLFSPCFYSYLI